LAELFLKNALPLPNDFLNSARSYRPPDPDYYRGTGRGRLLIGFLVKVLTGEEESMACGARGIDLL
jgi:hypothetical protein